VQQVGLVPDEGAVKQFVSAGLHPPFHDRVHPGYARAEQLLVATGRRPVTNGLNLAAVDVTVGPRGEVVVDEYLRTTNPRVWAAGDVTGSPQFVYVAGAQGALVADNAIDKADRTLDYRHLPRVTFTSPAIASVGMTDTHAQATGIACDCRVLPLRHVPRALVNRDTRGLIKLVACQCARVWLSSIDRPRSRPSMIDQNREHCVGSPAGHCRPCSSAVRATSIRCCCSANSANL
jgi:hypothetical protein